MNSHEQSDYTLIDWAIIGIYLAGLIALSAWLSRSQHSRADYYVAGRHTGPSPIAISVMATQFAHHGLGDGRDFAFWPMLFGGVFLYVSYYGCDQSQVQRELCARSVDDGNRALFINGLLRFHLVSVLPDWR
jgi:hypothetical protein